MLASGGGPARSGPGWTPSADGSRWPARANGSASIRCSLRIWPRKSAIWPPPRVGVDSKYQWFTRTGEPVTARSDNVTVGSDDSGLMRGASMVIDGLIQQVLERVQQ